MDQNPNQPPQIQPQPQPVGSTPAQPQPATLAPAAPIRPSMGLAITAFVLSILGFLTSWIGIGILLALVALVLAIVSLSKRLGGKGLSIAAIVISGLALVSGFILLAITIVAYNGIQARAEASANQSTAYMILKKAEAYNALEGSYSGDSYPTYQQLTNNNIPEARLDQSITDQLHQGDQASVSQSEPIAYQGCAYGAAVYFYDSSAANVGHRTAGNFARC